MADEASTIETEAVVFGLSPKIGWQLQLLSGFITLVLGIVLAFHPTTSINVVCVIFGILLIVGGIFHFIRVLDPEEQHRAWLGIAGLLEVVVGVVLIRHLDVARALIALLIGITWIVQGTVSLMVGILGGSTRSRVWPIIFGVISIAAGAVVIAVPASSVTVLAVLVGIWFIVMGVLQILAGFFLRSDLKKAGVS